VGAPAPAPGPALGAKDEEEDEDEDEEGSITAKGWKMKSMMRKGVGQGTTGTW